MYGDDNERDCMAQRAGKYDRDRDYDCEDRKTRMEKTHTGDYVRVTRFADGSRITDFGGPAGSVRTNRYGEEC